MHRARVQATMCGRHACTLAPEDAISMLKAKWRGDSSKTKYQPSYNIGPTNFSVCMVRGQYGGREICHMRWGFHLGPCGLTINARSETLTQKRTFKGLVEQHRCIVISEGFYEWQRLKGGKRQPYFFHTGTELPLLLAGLYSIRVQPDGTEYYDFVVVTVPAHDRYALVHDRMPAIVHPDLIDIWLGDDSDLALSILTPVDSLSFHQVSNFVGVITNDGPNCIAPIAGTKIEAGDIRKFIPLAMSQGWKREVKDEEMCDVKPCHKREQAVVKREKSTDCVEIIDEVKDAWRRKREVIAEPPAAAILRISSNPLLTTKKTRSGHIVHETKRLRADDE